MKRFLLSLLVLFTFTASAWAVRIPSETVDQYIYFVALDSADFTTRKIGLTTFTVYISKNGGTAAADASVTIVETDSTNMPGVYQYQCTEQMTIGTGNDTEEICIHISHAGMAPVTRTIELYRPKITEGETVVAANGAAEANNQYWIDVPITKQLITLGDINDQVVDVIDVDVSGEPPQGAPGVSISLREKTDWLYKAFRNKITQTSSTYGIWNAAGDTIDHKATTSDDGTTYTRTEIGSGP